MAHASAAARREHEDLAYVHIFAGRSPAGSVFVTHLITNLTALHVFLLSQCIEPYLSRRPTGPGEAIENVMWQKFANHVQKIADSLGTGKAGDY